jgi:hypothetical protein
VNTYDPADRILYVHMAREPDPCSDSADAGGRARDVHSGRRQPGMSSQASSPQPKFDSNERRVLVGPEDGRGSCPREGTRAGFGRCRPG